MMGKVDFLRFFKNQSSDNWRVIMSLSKQKEMVDI